MPGKTKVGIVSRHCVGNWQGKKQGISAATIEGEAVFESSPQQKGTNCFLYDSTAKSSASRQIGKSLC